MNFIQETCNQIVVPPKLKYSTMDLGYAITSYGRRYDFDVRNNDNQNLKCSLYVPKNPNASKICVMYLHSMNGSRLQCLSYVDQVLARGFFMCSFDFSGCGNSEGACISFGANQKYDVAAVTEEIVAKYGLTRYILWGRSMGAVASLKYCQMMMTSCSLVEIHGIILDSPFQSLKKLIIELGAKRSDLPKLFVHLFYLKKGKFCIEDLELIKTVKAIEGVPISFMVSKDDTTIDSSHSEALYKAYQFWDKRLVYFSGLHNESRDQDYMSSVISFLEDKRARVNQTKRSLKYKRIMLEKEIIRKNIAEGERNGECECNIFPSRH